MVDNRTSIDLDRYIRTKARITNESGTKGYSQGVRVFNCPFCGDTKGRGWMSVQYFAAGCFNMGCIAAREGFGAIEWVRRVENLVTRSQVWYFLRDNFGTARPIAFKPRPTTGPDFCRFPPGMREFDWTGSPLQDEFMSFANKQWGITLPDARERQLGWCHSGRYAWRIVIPVLLNGQPIAFQARSIKGAEPKYKTSKSGAEADPSAECGRPIGETFYNYDALPVESEALLVEGPGDVMGWHRGSPWRAPHALGLLGQALTPTRIALLQARRVERVIVGLDAEPEARVAAESLLEDLEAWDFPVAVGLWTGGKDAGQGANLEIQDWSKSTFRKAHMGLAEVRRDDRPSRDFRR